MNLFPLLRRSGVTGVDGAESKTAFRFFFRRKKPGLGVLGLLVAAMGFILSPASVHASDRWETLQAIHLVENPTNSTRVGSRGELGPYQFRPTTWKMYTTKPFRLATDREEADQVAIRHYEWIKQGLVRGGIEPTPYHVAMAWNAGLSATVRGHAPASSRAYAVRVQTIARDLQRQQLAVQP